MSYATSKLVVNQHFGNGAIDVGAAIRTLTTANANARNRREEFKAVARDTRSTIAIHPQRVHKVMRRGALQLFVLDLIN